MFRRIKEEMGRFSSREVFFLLSAMLCGFLICGEYAIIRPASNSFFISTYSASVFPYAWLLAVPLNYLIVKLYNRFLPRIGFMRMFVTIAAIIACGNLLSALLITKVFFLPFLFYIWKEIYIMLMLQQLWSVVHATIDIKRAKYLYGILFGIGGLGGACGSMVPGFFAVEMGSQNLLFLSLPIYALLLFAYRQLLKNSPVTGSGATLAESKEPFRAFKNIKSSPFLLFIFLVVIFMQTTSTIVDFQFNTLLEKTIAAIDLRTEYVGRVMGIVNVATIILQFVGSFLLVQFLGVRRSHFLIPSLLCLNAVGFLFAPVFGLISFSFVTIKSFDFSIFGIVKEMLYIPLSTDEKFRAKAFIDVFAYRSAKAFASLLILLLQFTLGATLVSSLTTLAIVLFVLWGATVVKLLKKESAATVKEPE